MTINEIMMRDLMEEERKQRKREEAAEARHDAGDECGFPWLAVAVWLAAGLAMLGAAFFAGTWWQSRRELVIDREYNAWFEKVANEAVELAEKMKNAELLTTERECAPAN